MKTSVRPTTVSAAPSTRKPSAFHRLGETAEDIDLGILVEIDQDVAAEDDVEGAELGEIVQQIQLPMLNHGAQLRADLPKLAVLLEIFDEQLNRKAALDLELAVDARFRFLEHFRGQVGRDDFDAPSGERRAHFLQAMASEYGSWPVEPAAHQILMLLRPARAFNISGMIVSRK